MMMLKSIVKRLPGFRQLVAHRNLLLLENQRLNSEMIELKRPVEATPPSGLQPSDYAVKCFDHSAIPCRKD